jgi:hypothetical protein
MRKHFPPTTFAVPVLALMLCVGMRAAVAQQMEHSAPTTPSTRLTIKTYDGKTLTLTPEELAALPHKSVSVFNAHSKTNETYSGVPLADLLSKAGVPLGESVRGKLFMIGIIAAGMDGYVSCTPWLKSTRQSTPAT